MWYQLYRQYKEGKIDIKTFNQRCTMYHVKEEDRIKALNWLYTGKYITKDEFIQFVKDGYITIEEYSEITGEEYIDNSEDTQDN